MSVYNGSLIVWKVQIHSTTSCRTFYSEFQEFVLKRKKQYFEIKRKETRGELGITTTITMRFIIQPMPKNEG